ncbi:hypothetical protein CNY89_29055, partial [Amaricoccus sp. HAR-UPW-R2A-40]
APIAMTTPLSTPRPIGPASAIRAKTNSIGLIRQIARSAATSIRLIAAAGYGHPSQIMEEIARLTPTFAGVTYDKLDAEGSI